MANNIPNSFIIDLIENQVFPRSNNTIDDQTTFVAKQNNIVPEIHNGIFLFANKQGRIRADNIVYGSDIVSTYHYLYQKESSYDLIVSVVNPFIKSTVEVLK